MEQLMNLFNTTSNTMNSVLNDIKLCEKTIKKCGGTLTNIVGYSIMPYRSDLMSSDLSDFIKINHYKEIAKRLKKIEKKSDIKELFELPTKSEQVLVASALSKYAPLQTTITDAIMKVFSKIITEENVDCVHDILPDNTKLTDSEKFKYGKFIDELRKKFNYRVEETEKMYDEYIKV
jgi:hypothetical protein